MKTIDERKMCKRRDPSICSAEFVVVMSVLGDGVAGAKLGFMFDPEGSLVSKDPSREGEGENEARKHTHFWNL